MSSTRQVSALCPTTNRGIKGFTLIEVMVAVSIFAIIAVAIYQGYVSVYTVSRVSRLKIAATALANEQLEIIRNLPYPDVGIVGGIPVGKIPRVQTLDREGTELTVETTIRNIDDPFDGTLGGIPNDTAPADYKIAEVYITCATCERFQPFSVTTTVAPKNLETATGNGALFIQVLDANGLAIQGASVHIENTAAEPDIIIDDVTNNDGILQIVDTPPGVEAYEIEVTKAEYSTDRTYPPGVPGNPNPVKSHATVVAQGVTQISFAIDRLSTLEVSTRRDTCAPVDDVNFLLEGSKLIGTNPDVKKYSASHTTNSNGEKIIDGLEWDTYSATLTSATYDLLGSIPLLPLSLIPNTTQPLSLIVGEKNPLTLLVNVQESGTQLPLAGANVTLSKTGYENTLATGVGFLRQTDWSGGAGQESFVNASQYFSAESTIAHASPAGELKLQPGATSGMLESSTFDTGSDSEFHQILWQPQNQPLETGPDSVRFQISTKKNPQAAWVFKGPDGSSNTYYTLSNTNINENHKNDRYLRYRIFLKTDTPSVSPNVADVSFTFTSACVPPGQAVFTGLSTGEYTLAVSRAGYQSFTDTVTVAASWQQESVSLNPQ